MFVIKRLVITEMFCDRLHGWLLIQSRLTTLLTSLIARRKVGPQTERYHPKPYLIVTWAVGN